MTEKFTYTESELRELLEGISSGAISEYNIPESLYLKISDYLKSGLYKGFGGNLTDFSGKDLELLTELRENVYMFSAAKSFTEMSEFRTLLFNEDGERRTLPEFLQYGEQSFEKFNDDWGRTEYYTAEGQAQMASKWQEIERNKDILPILEYSAIGDACAICQPLEGMTAEVDDPIWNNITPLNHFNCACVLIQHDADKQLTPDSEKNEVYKEVTGKMSDVFKMNPGKDKYVFSPDHPYFDVAKKDIEFAKNNFGLPIPSVKEEVGNVTPSFTSTKTAKETEDYISNPDNKFRKLDDKERAKFAKNFKSYLSGIDVGQLDSEMELMAEKYGFNWTKKSIEETAFRNGLDIVYRGTSANGESVRLVRSFYLRDGKRYVEHELFQLPKALQGNGLSKDVLSSFYKQYEKSGINNISIHANIDVCGYAWGKYGFSAEKKSAEVILNSVKKEPYYNDAKKIFTQHFKDDPSATVFPMNKWANAEFGDKMLLGSDWNGGLNLRDSEQKAIFESYLSKKK